VDSPRPVAGIFKKQSGRSLVKVIALKSYRTGYLGFLEEPDHYVFFSCARNGTIKRVKSYDRADYFNLDHFLSVITKFVPRRFFLEEGFEIATLSARVLDQISKERL
jgi:hypothetical protein